GPSVLQLSQTRSEVCDWAATALSTTMLALTVPLGSLPQRGSSALPAAGITTAGSLLCTMIERFDSSFATLSLMIILRANNASPGAGAAVETSVACWPTIGAMLLSNASMNDSTCRRCGSPATPLGKPPGLGTGRPPGLFWLNTAA